MFAVIALTGRLLLAHWPALVAWFLAGILARYVAIEIAGFVGGYTAVGGVLLLPLGILARLVSFVAMFLVLREGLPHLRSLAPLPEGRAERRREFVDALLGAVLPFFLFYAAWGYLGEDVAAYLNRALEVQSGRLFGSIFTGETVSTEGTVDKLGFEPLTIGLIVLAFAGRWAFKRYREKLPRWSAIGAVYLEAVWVFLTVYLIADALGAVSDWVQTRQAIVWLGELRAWLASQVAPLAWAWEAVEWFLGEAGGILLLPLAWLTIAGVIYGQAVTAKAPELGGEVVERARARYASVPARIRRRLRDVWDDLVSRFHPIARALVLMWRAGPVLIGGYVLLYTIVLAVEGALDLALMRLVGPHDLVMFWTVASSLLFLVVPVLVEPLRISLIASGYDAALTRLAPASGRDVEADEAGELVDSGDIDGEGSPRVVGDEEGRDEGVGSDGVPIA